MEDSLQRRVNILVLSSTCYSIAKYNIKYQTCKNQLTEVNPHNVCLSGVRYMFNCTDLALQQILKIYKSCKSVAAQTISLMLIIIKYELILTKVYHLTVAGSLCEQPGEKNKYLWIRSLHVLAVISTMLIFFQGSAVVINGGDIILYKLFLQGQFLYAPENI